MRSFVYSASRERTYSVSVAKLTHVRSVNGRDVEKQDVCVLGKATELARPDFLCVGIVGDVVVRFEGAMVEISVLVNAGIIVISEA
jgi:hypothetical protein